MYLRIIIYGTGILLLFRILSYLNKILPFSRKTKHFSGYLLPIIELAVWIGFAIWFLRYIYEAEAFTTLIFIGIVIVLLIAPVWFLVRDFLHGMFLKIQRKIEIGSRIEIGELNGIIEKTDYFTFDIKTKDGDIDTIPYNKIRSEIITKNAANIHLEKQLITFIIPSKQHINKILPQLKTTLINTPWVAVSQEPIINKISTEADISVVEVIVYMLKKEYTENIIEYVKTNFIDKLN